MQRTLGTSGPATNLQPDCRLRIPGLGGPICSRKDRTQPMQELLLWGRGDGGLGASSPRLCFSKPQCPHFAKQGVNSTRPLLYAQP